MFRRRAIVFAALLFGCSSRAEPLLIEWAGCSAFLASGACELDGDAPLTGWLPISVEETLVVESGGDAIAVENEPAGVGRRVRVPVPREASSLDVEVRSKTGVRRAVLPIAWAKTATTSAAKKSFELAKQKIRSGDSDGAFAMYVRAAEQAENEPSLRVRAAIGAAYIEGTLRGELAAATVRLDALAEPPFADAHSRALLAYQRGVFARLLGDHRAAVRAQDVAEDISMRLALPLSSMVDNERAIALIELGRGDEAQAIFRSLIANPNVARDPCLRADAMSNATWAALTASKARSDEEVRKWIEDALEIRRVHCPNTERENNDRVNLALFHLRRGELDAVKNALKNVRGAEQSDAYLWRLAIEARAAFDDHRLRDAEREYQKLRDAARKTSFDELEWMAALGSGRVQEALHHLPPAIADYQEAERILERQSLMFPLDRGRLFFLENRSASQELLASALLGAGRKVEAFDARRRARRRVLVALDPAPISKRANKASRSAFLERSARYRQARDALDRANADIWKESLADAERQRVQREALQKKTRDALSDVLALSIPEDRTELARAELRAPNSGELFVATFPNREGWESWARDANEAQIFLTKEQPSGQMILDHFRALIDRAERIVVLSGELELHAVADAGRPLGAVKSVVYALDLPPRARTAREGGALVVADPRGDLSWAREEGGRVKAALEKSGVRTVLLELDGARVEAVRRGISNVERLHYAGHAELAGDEGWDTALLLADGALSVGDIATSSIAPAEVVLTGCETAADRSGRVTAGIGLAHAFILGGAEAVIAVPERVADRSARDFALALYGSNSANEALEASYRRALATLRADESLSFRMVVR